jgi:prefoldin subunit 5
MVLPVGAKSLIGLILALGLATSVGAGISAGSAISSAMHRSNELNQLNAAIAENNKAVHQNERAISQVNGALARITSAHTRLGSQLNLVDDMAQACSTEGCFNSGAVRGANAVAVFERRLHAVAIPPPSDAAERKFASVVTRYKQAWVRMGHSVSFTDYANRAERAAKAGRQFDPDYQALIASLDKLGATLNKQATSLNQSSNSLNRQAAALNAGR